VRLKESPAFTRSYELLQWLIPVTVKFPRQHRFVLARALQKTAFELHEHLIEAAKNEEPLPFLRQADVSLTKLRFYLRLCRDLELLKLGQYAHVSRIANEVGKLLGGWMKKITESEGELGATPVNEQIASPKTGSQ
jgi:hypothetical protein